MFGSDVMNAMADRIQSVVVYNKDVNVDVQDIFSNLIPYIESNHMYTYIRNDSVCRASCAAVQKMLAGDVDAKQAVKVFNNNYNAVKENPLLLPHLTGNISGEYQIQEVRHFQ